MPCGLQLRRRQESTMPAFTVVHKKAFAVGVACFSPTADLLAYAAADNSVHVVVSCCCHRGSRVRNCLRTSEACCVSSPHMTAE